MHALEHLAEWPGGDGRSRLVFIASGLNGQQVDDSWQSFQRFFAQDNGAQPGAPARPLIDKEHPTRKNMPELRVLGTSVT